jgi:hypothetical protein
VSDHRNSDIVSKGGGGFRWPWTGGQDVNIGSGSRMENSTVNLGSPARVQNSTVNLGSTERVGNSTVDAEPSGRARRAERRRKRAARLNRSSGDAGWRGLVVTIVVMAAFAFHAIPHAARLGGTISPDEVRGFLVSVGGFLPVIGDVDLARWLVPAASAWLWQPFAAVIGAGVLRMVSLNTAQRNPRAAIWIAGAALLVDAAAWVFMGLRLWGEAYSAFEGEALITLLKVEAGALLAMFFLLRPGRGKRPEQADAVLNGDN